MMETNEEITIRLKQSIHDYYMGYIKQKLKAFLINGKEIEISNKIMQFLDAQIDTENGIIVKDNIVNILNSVLLDNITNNGILNEEYIANCFPNVADITIEDSSAVYLEEKTQTLFNGLDEKSYYLYVSPEYYDKNIKNIESEIKKFEKTFSKQSLKEYEQKFNEHLTSKQYELESAKVYESASKQIELKKQKFSNANQKILNEYGKKYKEIISGDSTEEEKFTLAKQLLEDTKSSDEKNRQAILRLNSEYDNLSKNFKGKVNDVNTIHKQMQNLHLFDKNRYFEDMKACSNPTLQDLYKKRYLLNSYRKAHNELIYTEKPNIFATFLDKISNKSQSNRLLLGPHFERDYTESTSTYTAYDIDKNLIKRLANYYSNVVSEQTIEFENTLVEYFSKNYKELISDKSSEFLQKFSQEGTENVEEGDLFKIARHLKIDTTPFKNNFGSNLIIKDNLIYKEDENGLNVIYATDKSINSTIENLYSTALYYKHLARENAMNSIKSIALQNAFIEYAQSHNIELENNRNNQDLNSSSIQKNTVKTKIPRANINS